MATDQIGGLSGVATPPHPIAAGRPLVPVSPSKVAQSSDVGATQDEPSITQVREATKSIKELLPPSAKDLQFSIDDDSGKIIVKLIDTNTQTVLRQIPTKEVLEIAKALDKLQGLLVKQKA